MAGLILTPAANAARAKAKEFGLRETSGYRSPQKDKEVGGTGRGYHTLGLALDFAGSQANMDKFAKWAKSSGLFRSVLWQVPDHYDHVHVSWEKGGAGTYTPPTGGIVKEGNKGGIVEAIQKLVGGIKADGYFGEQTEAAVKQFQANRKIEVDGIVGSQTWKELTNGGSGFFS